jgi:uncharacterized repeat protein (TIGR03847 family)
MIDFGVAKDVEARSSGEPGQRTFHLRIIGEGGQSAALKLEKQHLVGLLTGVRRLLEQIGYAEKPEVRAAAEFPTTADYDFAVGNLGIGFSTEAGTIVVEAAELEAEDNQEATAIRVRLSRRQGAWLATQLEKIIAAGRPICPLCWTPIDREGHVCARSNGHSRQPIPDEQADQE